MSNIMIAKLIAAERKLRMTRALTAVARGQATQAEADADADLWYRIACAFEGGSTENLTALDGRWEDAITASLRATAKALRDVGDDEGNPEKNKRLLDIARIARAVTARAETWHGHAGATDRYHAVFHPATELEQAA